jgi:hypothetical protein
VPGAAAVRETSATSGMMAVNGLRTTPCNTMAPRNEEIRRRGGGPRRSSEVY